MHWVILSACLGTRSQGRCLSNCSGSDEMIPKSPVTSNLQNITLFLREKNRNFVENHQLGLWSSGKSVFSATGWERSTPEMWWHCCSSGWTSPLQLFFLAGNGRGWGELQRLCWRHLSGGDTEQTHGEASEPWAHCQVPQCSSQEPPFAAQTCNKSGQRLISAANETTALETARTGHEL